MTAATQLQSRGGRRSYRINATLTIDCGAGMVIERYICTASTSGTLVFSDSTGMTTTTAFTFTANNVYEFNLPCAGTLTCTVTGTLDGIIVLRDTGAY